ncbi:MAG: 2-dehydropantoate 2-reductase [Kiritimatiellae bacterium]|nr:2-dehydropantoate 2-reductase [Kiritimatiellia bacterium]
MKIYVDMDDVLTETARELSRLAAALFDIHVPYEKIFAFDLKQSFHLTDEEYLHLMRGAHWKGALEGLPETPGAREGVAQLLKQGHEVVIVTGRPLQTANVSQGWLRQHGFPELPFYCLDKYGRWSGGDSADPRLLTREAFEQTRFDLFIDDSPLALDLLQNRSDSRILVFDRPWNRDYPLTSSMRRVFGWDEVVAAANAATTE